ncbi:MAG: hypothetical protein WDO13_06750 [Verrucomicrobiota bacterium]
MQLIDWIIVGSALLLVLGIAIYTQTYMRSVADFLSAGRVARSLPAGRVEGRDAGRCGGLRRGVGGVQQGRVHRGLVGQPYLADRAGRDHLRLRHLPLSRDARADVGPVLRDPLQQGVPALRRLLGLCRRPA